MKILLTAFEPFGGDTINPALEAVNQLPNTLEGATLLKYTLPTVFDEALAQVYQVMVREQPDVVLCIGQAGGRAALTPERVAINLNDAPIPDNRGNQPIDTPVFPGGPAAYFSNLPVKAMVQAIREAGLPAFLSNSAGTFVCNHLMYGVLHFIAKDFPGMRGGFIHVPFIPAQVLQRPAGTPSLSLAHITEGLAAAIKAILQPPPETKINTGTDC